MLVLQEPTRFEKSRLTSTCAGLAPASASPASATRSSAFRNEGRDAQAPPGAGRPYVLSPFDEDSDLRRHGEKIAQRSSKNAKKQVVLAVARKLAVCCTFCT